MTRTTLSGISGSSVVVRRAVTRPSCQRKTPSPSEPIQSEPSRASHRARTLRGSPSAELRFVKRPSWSCAQPAAERPDPDIAIGAGPDRIRLARRQPVFLAERAERLPRQSIQTIERPQPHASISVAANRKDVARDRVAKVERHLAFRDHRLKGPRNEPLRAREAAHPQTPPRRLRKASR